MHYLLKQIPKKSLTAHQWVVVNFDEKEFATIKADSIPPGSKFYIPVMIAIDKLMDPMMRSMMEDSGLWGIMSAMAGELDTKTTEDFVKNSEIMQKFTITFQ